MVPELAKNRVALVPTGELDEGVRPLTCSARDSLHLPGNETSLDSTPKIGETRVIISGQ